MHNQLIEFRTNARACAPLIRFVRGGVCVSGCEGVRVCGCSLSYGRPLFNSDIESYSTEAEYVEILEDVHEVLLARLVTRGVGARCSSDRHQIVSSVLKPCTS